MPLAMFSIKLTSLPQAFKKKDLDYDDSLVLERGCVEKLGPYKFLIEN